MNPKLFFTLLIPFLSSLIACQSIPKKDVNQEKICSIERQSKFVTANGDVTEPIVQLLEISGIRLAGNPKNAERNWPEAKLLLKTKKLEEVVAAVQGKVDSTINWLGDPRKEQWEQDPLRLQFSLNQAKSIIQICREFGLVSEKNAHFPIKGILFLGSTLSSVRERLAFLNKLYETKGLSPQIPVYILTGERKLDPLVGETKEKLMDSANGTISFREDYAPKKILIDDEGAMTELVFSQSRHKDLKKDNLLMVYSPKGQGRRATTESTVVQWLKDYDPSSGTYIAISSQPYVFYQESVINRVLYQKGRKDVCVHAVGPASKLTSDDSDALVDQARSLLNIISRILYELRTLRTVL